jgi:hypothetical protein
MNFAVKSKRACLWQELCGGGAELDFLLPFNRAALQKRFKACVCMPPQVFDVGAQNFEPLLS